MTDSSADAFGAHRELDLTPDRFPRTVWVAAGIPIFTAALIFWLAAYWQQLSYRGYADDPDWLWRRNAYETMVRGILMFLAFEMWLVVYGLAHWYGSPRSESRDGRLNVAIANAWFMALAIPAIQFSVTLDLSWRGMVLCATMVLGGFSALVATARRSRGERTSTASGQFVYFDRQDPALVSARGINMGNPWQWALLVGGFLPSLVILLLLWIQHR